MRAESYVVNYRMILFLKQETKNITKKCYTATYTYWITNIVQKKYYEVLSIAKTKGRKHLFITMSCNPNHHHILEAIDKAMEPSYIPEIRAHIFKEHVKVMVKSHLIVIYLDGKNLLD